jgi:cytochrome c
MSDHNLEFNKLAAGFLLAGIIAMTAGFIADGLYNPKEVEKRGFSVEVAEVATAGAAPVAEIDVGTLLASADAGRGEAAAMKKCTACHTFESGGSNKVGPNLFGIVGNKIAHKDDFAYSDGVKNHGGNWSYEDLNHWLKAPASFIKGNKMAFAGLKNDAERADVIMYLKSISAGAPAVPAPKPAEAAAEEPKADAKATEAKPEAAKK